MLEPTFFIASHFLWESEAVTFECCGRELHCRWSQLKMHLFTMFLYAHCGQKVFSVVIDVSLARMLRLSASCFYQNHDQTVT